MHNARITIPTQVFGLRGVGIDDCLLKPSYNYGLPSGWMVPRSLSENRLIYFEQAWLRIFPDQIC